MTIDLKKKCVNVVIFSRPY